MSRSDGEGLVFVVDVTSFTKSGFVGSTNYGGECIDIEFDDGDEGISLTGEMAERIGARKGSPLLVVVEDDRTQIATAAVASVGKAIRISNMKVYYAVGREGGAVVRIRKQ